MEELLPLWCFKGVAAPEFLEKDSRWRFYDRGPEKFLELDRVPIEVKDFLAGLKPKAEEGSSAYEEDAPTEKGSKEDQSALERLKAQLLDPEEEEKGDGFDLAAFKKKRLEQAQKDAEELRQEMNAIEAADAAARPKREDIEAQLEDLRSKLEDPKETPKQNTAPSVVDSLEGKVESSEAAAFLKKRKAAMEANPELEKVIGRKHIAMTAAAARELAGTKATAKVKIGDAIAISLLVSDALFDGRNLLEKPETLLRTIADRFGNTRVTILEAEANNTAEAKVLASTDETHPAGKILPVNPDSEEILSLARWLNHQASKQALGALLLEPIAPREKFETSDGFVLDAIAKILSDYWTSLNSRMKGGKAA